MMTNNCLILGPSGRFGRHTMTEFISRGWVVTPFRRNVDDLETLAANADVIVFGWHLKYSDWEAQYDALVDTVIAAAQINNATILFPGNVYIYGKNPDPVWGRNTAHHAANTLCKVRSRIEARLESSGVQTIIVRSGDFVDTEQSGTWFDMVVSKKLGRGILTYPGDPTARHAWGFLPDIARAAVDLAEMRSDLGHFVDVAVPGYAISAQEMADTFAQILNRDVVVRPMSWTFFRVLSPVWPVARHIIAMRYLWSHPHELDGRALSHHLPSFRQTPLRDALSQAICIK